MRAITGLGLKEAKELVEKAPSDVKADVKKEEAEEIRRSSRRWAARSSSSKEHARRGPIGRQLRWSARVATPCGHHRISRSASFSHTLSFLHYHPLMILIQFTVHRCCSELLPLYTRAQQGALWALPLLGR